MKEKGSDRCFVIKKREFQEAIHQWLNAHERKGRGSDVVTEAVIGIMLDCDYDQDTQIVAWPTYDAENCAIKWREEQIPKGTVEYLSKDQALGRFTNARSLPRDRNQCKSDRLRFFLPESKGRYFGFDPEVMVWLAVRAKFRISNSDVIRLEPGKEKHLSGLVEIPREIVVRLFDDLHSQLEAYATKREEAYNQLPFSDKRFWW